MHNDLLQEYQGSILTAANECVLRPRRERTAGEAKICRPVTAISSASPVPVISWPWPRSQSRSLARSGNPAARPPVRSGTLMDSAAGRSGGSLGVVP